MTVLGNMPEHLINRFHKLLRKYLWNDSVPLVHLEVLQTSKCSGGLRLVDLHSKEKSFKVQWVLKRQALLFFANIVVKKQTNL